LGLQQRRRGSEPLAPLIFKHALFSYTRRTTTCFTTPLPPLANAQHTYKAPDAIPTAARVPCPLRQDAEHDTTAAPPAFFFAARRANLA